MSVRILLCSNPVQLTAELSVALQSPPKLVLRHRGEPLSENDDALEIVLESSAPVTVAIPDFDHDNQRWTVTATPKGNAGNPSDPGPGWERQDGLCCTRWGETSTTVAVTVTATSGQSQAKVEKVFFIKVLPEGARPWP